jgi:hypothetical protein
LVPHAGNVPQVLRLKVGAQVVLLKNLNPARGLVNGSRGVVCGFDKSAAHLAEHAPRVRFANGIVRTIEREQWESKTGDIVHARCSQIPLALAWAITIHKSQGMTLDCAHIALAECFEYGQAYVALSRVRSLAGLGLLSLDPSKILAHPRVVAFYRDLASKTPPPLLAPSPPASLVITPEPVPKPRPPARPPAGATIPPAESKPNAKYDSKAAESEPNAKCDSKAAAESEPNAKCDSKAAELAHDLASRAESRAEGEPDCEMGSSWAAVYAAMSDENHSVISTVPVREAAWHTDRKVCDPGVGYPGSGHKRKAGIDFDAEPPAAKKRVSLSELDDLESEQPGLEEAEAPDALDVLRDLGQL